MTTALAVYTHRIDAAIEAANMLPVELRQDFNDLLADHSFEDALAIVLGRAPSRTRPATSMLAPVVHALPGRVEPQPVRPIDIWDLVRDFAAATWLLLRLHPLGFVGPALLVAGTAYLLWEVVG